MTFPLHKSPQGLLELFRLRTLGKNPPEFGEIVTPTVDVTDFYGADLMQTGALAGAAGAINNSLSWPQSNFPRRIIHVNGQIAIGAAAGTSLTLSLTYQLPQATPALQIFASTQLIGALVAGQVYVVTYQGPPFVLPPGHLLGITSAGNAAGADHTLSHRFTFQTLSSDS